MSAAAAPAPVSEKHLVAAMEEMHFAAAGAGVGYTGPHLTPAWLASELKHENEDEGPDMASHFLEDPTAAEEVLVVLGRTDGDIEIVPANELDVWTDAHGLYSLAELGFSDDDAQAFIDNHDAVMPLEDEVARLESRLAELEGGVDHRTTLLVILDPTSASTAGLAEEAEQMQVELDRLNKEYEERKFELDDAKLALHEFTKQVRRAVVRTFKPLRKAVVVRELLRKYEEGEEGEEL